MKKFAFTKILRALLVLAATMGFCLEAAAASQVVWQIGKFDRASMEFTRREAPAPKPGAAPAQNDLVYVIGKSKAETDWPGFQRGSSNGIAATGAILTPSNSICRRVRRGCTR